MKPLISAGCAYGGNSFNAPLENFFFLTPQSTLIKIWKPRLRVLLKARNLSCTRSPAQKIALAEGEYIITCNAEYSPMCSHCRFKMPQIFPSDSSETGWTLYVFNTVIY